MGKTCSCPGSDRTVGRVRVRVRVPSNQLLSVVVSAVCSIQQSSWGSIVAVKPVIFALWLLDVNSDLDLLVLLS